MTDLELKKGIAERLELKIRRHYSNWMRAILNAIVYGIAVGIPWIIGAVWIADAVISKGGL